jgi:hypothetical protein
MRQHLTETEVLRYQQRVSSAEELLQTDAHLAECAECRKRVTDALHAEHDTHLSYEQLERFVDTAASQEEQQAVASHVKICPACAGELADLQSFRTELAGSTKSSPWNSPAIGLSGPPASSRRISFATEPRAFLRTFRWIPFAIAAAAAGVLIGIVDLKVATPPPDRTHTLNLLTATERQGVLDSIERGEIIIPEDLKSLRGPDQTLMGPAGQPQPTSMLKPAGERVLETTPLFHWRPVADAKTYQVGIFDTNLTLVEKSPDLAETQWKPAAPLQRGHTYLWQITASLSDGTVVNLPRPPAPEARFEVLGQSEAVELERVSQADPRAYTILGALYARAGLLTDAESELRKVTPDNPDYPKAQKLLSALRSFSTPQTEQGAPRATTCVTQSPLPPDAPGARESTGAPTCSAAPPPYPP